MLKTILTLLNKTKTQILSTITPKLNIFFIFIKKIFNRYNLTKVLIVFIFGFSIRLCINIFYDINVFTDFLTAISLTYYFFISCFAIVVHECVTHFSFSIFPSSFCSSISFLFSSNIFSSLNPFTLFKDYSSVFSQTNNNIKSLYSDINLSYFKISSIKRFIKYYLEQGKNILLTLCSSHAYIGGEKYTNINNPDSSLPKEKKGLESYLLLKNNKGKETSLTDSPSKKEDSIQDFSFRKSNDSYGEEQQTAPYPNKSPDTIKDTSIKSADDSSKYPSRIFFGDDHMYDGHSAIFNISSESSSNSNPSNGNPSNYKYETLPSTVYRAEYNGESSRYNGESSRYNGESSRYNGESSRYNQESYKYGDFQLYGNDDSGRNTPSTMSPLFQSREPSIYYNNDNNNNNNTLVNTSESLTKTSLKFEDLTINHPIYRTPSHRTPSAEY